MVAMLIDREVHARNDCKLMRLLKNAHLKYGRATIADAILDPIMQRNHRFT